MELGRGHCLGNRHGEGSPGLRPVPRGSAGGQCQLPPKSLKLILWQRLEEVQGVLEPDGPSLLPAGPQQ